MGAETTLHYPENMSEEDVAKIEKAYDGLDDCTKKEIKEIYISPKAHPVDPDTIGGYIPEENRIVLFNPVVKDVVVSEQRLGMHYSGKISIESIITHEAGHTFQDEILEPKFPKEYKQWMKLHHTRYPEIEEDPPTYYASFNYREDFAESYMLYKLHPNEFKHYNPERAAFLDRIFKKLEGGQE